MSPQGRKDVYAIQAMQLLDAALIWFAFWLASVLRAPVFDIVSTAVRSTIGQPMFKDNIRGLADITWLLFMVVPFTPLVLEMFGFYENPLQRTLAKTIPRVLKSYGLMFLAILLFSVLFKQSMSSRLVLLTAIPLSMLFLLLRDGAMSHYYRRRAELGHGRENVAFAGRAADIRELRANLPEAATAFWKIVGEFDLAAGDWETFQRMLKEETVARVIFAANHAQFEEVSQAIEICELQGVEAWVAAGFIRTHIARPTFDTLGNQPMLVLRSTPDLSWALLAKGIIDRVGAAVVLLATVWLWPLVAVVIKLQSPGPVFFRQQRAGRYGRPFRLLKFRTMVPDADQQLAALKQMAGNEMSGPTFKLADDPRVFPFGRFLRRFSIDELPQFVNVLRGDMSVVGPRPLPLYEADAIEKSAHRRRMSVKPGLTCLWQVKGRNQISSFEDWVRLDLEYIDNWSLWLDFTILLKTIPAVLLGRGAK